MFYDASVLFARNALIAMAVILEGLKAPTERHLADLEEAYVTLERFLSRHRYVAADHLTIADLSISTTLYATAIIKEIDPVKFPLTTAWWNKMKQEPSYKKIAQPSSLIAQQSMAFFIKKNNA